MKRSKANPVKNPDALTEGSHTILQVGDQVQTPLGLGKVKDIALQIGVYPCLKEKGGDRVELDPPKITVTIQETGQDTVVCPCELGLPNEKYDKVLKSEYERLWPPMEQPAPEADENAVGVDMDVAKEAKAVVIAYKQRKLPKAQANRRLAALKQVKTPKDLDAYRKALTMKRKQHGKTSFAGVRRIRQADELDDMLGDYADDPDETELGAVQHFMYRMTEYLTEILAEMDAKAKSILLSGGPEPWDDPSWIGSLEDFAQEVPSVVRMLRKGVLRGKALIEENEAGKAAPGRLRMLEHGGRRTDPKRRYRRSRRVRRR